MKRYVTCCLLSWMCFTTVVFAAPYKLGETTIDLSITGQSGNSIYIHLHEDERTALSAAKKFLAHHSGRLISISHHGGRNVKFTLHGRRYQFDPNRIFTSNGIRRTLSAHSANVSSDAVAVVTKFANRIKEMLGNQQIISLHNNANESIRSYLASGKYSRDVARVAYFPNQNPHNFFLVTEVGKFDALKNKGYNVVLQNNQHVRDDGSLSVYAAKHDIPYINVEAAHGALAAQMKMLGAI